MFDHLKSHLKGKVLILGIGNTLRSDDGLGALLAARITGKVPFLVWDVGVGPENYLGKLIKEKPDTVVMVDAVDFGGQPGECRLLETGDIQTTNFFATHNSSISLTINYLQSNLKVDIIILIVQPKSIAFGEELSPEIAQTLDELERWFYETGQEKR
jgi:hydrogenase 3 maturation protease